MALIFFTANRQFSTWNFGSNWPRCSKIADFSIYFRP